MAGTFYIVATPIGNLEDVTTRARQTLGKVDTVFSEDTRVTGKLLSHLGIKTRLSSYHQHSREEKKYEILRLLIEEKDLAFVTDAGTPGISDPGNELIDFLLGKEPSLMVVPIPGPSSLTAALSVCGFDVSKFLFLGFFPKKGRSKLILSMAESKSAFVFFESPARLLRTLSELKEALGGDRRIFVARELTKLHETCYRGAVAEVVKKVSSDTIKGEIVVVVEKA